MIENVASENKISGRVVLLLIALSVLGALAVPAWGDQHLPPAGTEEAGTGELEGTETEQNEAFLGPPCYLHEPDAVYTISGAGTYQGVDESGTWNEAVYEGSIDEGAGETLYDDGPITVTVDNAAAFYHGPNGIFGEAGDPPDQQDQDETCVEENLGSPVSADFTIEADDADGHIRDAAASSEPCSGSGWFARDGDDWVAEWTLDDDCEVHDATGMETEDASEGQLHRLEGVHEPCSEAPCDDNIRVDYTQYQVIEGEHLSLTGPASDHVSEPVTVVATFTDDGAGVSGKQVNFSVDPSGTASPSSGQDQTDSEGEATFEFTASASDDYTVTASATGVSDAQHVVEVSEAPSGPGDFDRVDAERLFPPDENDVASAVVDPDGDFAYFGTGESPAHVVQVDLDTFERTDRVDLEDDNQFAENNLTSAVIDPNGDYAYFGTSDTQSHRAVVVKVELGDDEEPGESFQRVEAVELTQVDELTAAVIDSTGDYAYFGTNTDPAKIVRIDLNSFGSTQEITLEGPGEEDAAYLTSAVIDSTDDYAYFGTDTEPGQVVKIGLNGFSSDDSLVLPFGTGGFTSAVIDSEDDFAYFGTDTEPGQVFKIHLGNFLEDSSETLASGEDGLRSAVIDPNDDYAYFGTDTEPGQVVQVDLETLATPETVELSEDEDFLRAAVLATDDGGDIFAYFASHTSPSSVIKVAVPDEE